MPRRLKVGPTSPEAIRRVIMHDMKITMNRIRSQINHLEKLQEMYAKGIDSDGKG